MPLFGKAKGRERRPADDLEDAAWAAYDNEISGALYPRLAQGPAWTNIRREPGVREKIKRLAEEVLRLEPRRASAYILLGHIAMEEGKMDELRAHYLRAIEVSYDPFDSAIWSGAILALENGPFDILAECLEKMYERRPDAMVARRLAEAYWSMGNLQKGIAFLTMHLQRNPEDKRCMKLKKMMESEL